MGLLIYQLSTFQEVKIQDITEMLSWPRNRLYDEGTAAVAENLSPSVLGLK